MEIVNVSKSFVPRVQPFLFQLNDLLTKPTPKAVLAVSSNSMILAFLTNVLFIDDLMLVAQMRLILFTPEKDVCALLDLT